VTVQVHGVNHHAPVLHLETHVLAFAHLQRIGVRVLLPLRFGKSRFCPLPYTKEITSQFW
jgi:hypothetical protein